MNKRAWIPALMGMTMLTTGIAGAAEPQILPYYIYRDVGGRTVISNRTPPPTAQNIKRYDWTEATDAEIAQTMRENRAVEAINLERERIAATEKLAAAITAANARTREPARIEVNQVTVTPSLFPPPKGKGGMQARERRTRRARP